MPKSCNMGTWHWRQIWWQRCFSTQRSELFDYVYRLDPSCSKLNTKKKVNYLLYVSTSNSSSLKVVSATFLLVCFLSLNESTYQTRKNVFLIRFKSSFRSGENQILEFYIFKFHDVSKCLSIKREIHFTE